VSQLHHTLSERCKAPGDDITPNAVSASLVTSADSAHEDFSAAASCGTPPPSQDDNYLFDASDVDNAKFPGRIVAGIPTPEPSQE